jgi:hypothetical protein
MVTEVLTNTSGKPVLWSGNVSCRLEIIYMTTCIIKTKWVYRKILCVIFCVPCFIVKMFCNSVNVCFIFVSRVWHLIYSATENNLNAII